MLRDELAGEQEQQSSGALFGTWAEHALMKASARAQSWYETVRAYQRAYAKSRHFRRLAD
ncbi:MAG TPA: hypothetical protein VFZ61_18800 [Polyangiales bacterium]